MARDFLFSEHGAISDATANTITAFTLVGWFRWDGNQHSTTLIAGTNAAGPTVTWSHALRMTGADLFQAYAFDGSVRSINGTTTAAPGTWYHVAMTAANGAAMKLYVNGSLEATSGFTLGTLTTVLDRWRLGNSTSGTLFYSGDMAEVALFRSVLSAGDIASLAAGSASPLDVGAPRWYFPLCGTGTETDLSANALTLSWPSGTPVGSSHPVGIANGCGFARPKVGSFAFGADMDVKATRAISFNVSNDPVVDSTPNLFSVHGPIKLDGDVEITGALTGAATAPVGASYLTLGTHADLTSERVLTAGTGITLTDGGAGSTLTIAASGGGGGGGSTSTGAAGSEPGSPTAGDLYFPNNGFYVERYSGSAWATWGPMFPMTDPSTAGLSTWVNQGSSTVSTANGGVVLVGAATGSGANAVARVKTAPSTPYTITAFIMAAVFSKNFLGYGLCFRDSASGKMAIFDVLQLTTGNVTIVRSTKFTNATTFSADYTTIVSPINYNWLRITDNGTNRVCSVSVDGVTWVQIHSIGRTDFLTADQVGLAVSTENSATPNMPVVATLLSWKET